MRPAQVKPLISPELLNQILQSPDRVSRDTRKAELSLTPAVAVVAKALATEETPDTLPHQRGSETIFCHESRYEE
jgi:hypothetical protein